MKNRIGFYLLAIVALSLTGLGCGGKAGPQKLSTSNRVVEWLLADYEGLNPFNTTGANETYGEEQIFERLIACNPKTLEYNIPWLAEAMPVESADHLTFDFTIRKDIKFADGTPMTGDDVVFSLKVLKNPFNTLSGQKRTYVDCIHSAELVGDQYHVSFKLWKPYFLVKQAAFGDVLFIIEKKLFDPKGLTDTYTWDDIAAVVEKAAKGKEIDSTILAAHMNPNMKAQADWFTNTIEVQRDPKYIQGTGPYKLDKWVTQDMVRFIRNPYYVNHWGPIGDANPDTLIYKVINDFNSAVTALKAQDVDLIGFLQPQFWVKIDTAKQPFIKKTTFPLPSYALLGWNMKNPIFADVNVRRAMAYLVDRKTIVSKVLYGLANLTQSPVISTHHEYLKQPEIPFDPARAQAILDSAGWDKRNSDGVRYKMINGQKVPFSFTFLVNSGNETRKNILLIVTEAMRKVGIDAKISTLEWSIFLDRMRDHNFDARYGAWQQDPFEADNYQLYHSSQAANRGSNYDSWNSPRADELLTKIRAEMDDAKRLELQQEFQRVFYEEQPNTILWEPLNPVVYLDRFDSVAFTAYRPGYDISTWKIRGAIGATAKAAGF